LDKEERKKCIQDRFLEKAKHIQDKFRSAISIAKWYDALIIIFMSVVAYIVINDTKSSGIDTSTIHGTIVRGSSAFLALSLASTVFYVNLFHLWRRRITNGIESSFRDVDYFIKAQDRKGIDVIREFMKEMLSIQKMSTEWERKTKPKIKNYFITSFSILASCIICSLILMLLKHICPFPIHIIFICIEIIFIYIAFRLIALIINIIFVTLI